MVLEMKCSICGQQCGLFKSYHEDCKSAMIMAATKIYSIINRYENGNLACGKMEMIELIKNEPLYRTYLMNQISGKDQIYNNEIILYVEKNVAVSEQKNRCTMVRTGCRWERKPVWNPSSVLLSDSADMVFTDKAVYLLLMGSSMRYPYGKIVNIGYNDEKFMCPPEVFFDVKTTSPFPHRFFVWNKYQKEKAEKVKRVLSCIMGYKYMQ